MNTTDLVTRQRDSRENVKEFVMTSPHLMHVQSYHESQMRTVNVNANPKCEPKNEHDYRETFTSQQNITTHHNMTLTYHMRHICTPGNQTIKNNFAHETIC